jgi:hypothetical protein
MADNLANDLGENREMRQFMRLLFSSGTSLVSQFFGPVHYHIELGNYSDGQDT